MMSGSVLIMYIIMPKLFTYHKINNMCVQKDEKNS